MNILLDFIPFQHNNGVGGASSFAKVIVDTIVSKKEQDVNLFAIYDSRYKDGPRYNSIEIAQKHAITLCDVSKETISHYIDMHHIHVFFIAIGQYYAEYDLTGIQCKTIMFIHDIFDVERNDNWIDACIFDKNKEKPLTQAKRLFNLLSGRWKKRQHTLYDHIIPLYSAINTIPYTVSNYSKNALMYYFPEIRNEIRVCYSPLKQSEKQNTIENERLNEIIGSNKKYILMVSANRRYKNAKIVTKVFPRIAAEHPDIYLLTLGYGLTIHKQHIDIPYLSDSDLEHAYQHAVALLFPSFFEGFGYPPLEAMKYGTPVLASNVTSIPEITNHGGCLFSPLYPADLFRAIQCVLADSATMRQRALLRYQEISELQKKNLNELIDEILSSKHILLQI